MSKTKVIIEMRDHQAIKFEDDVDIVEIGTRISDDLKNKKFLPIPCDESFYFINTSEIKTIELWEVKNGK